MLLPRFDFDEPATLAEACQVLSEFGTRAKVVAGGTDLMVNMKKNLASPERLVSIARIPELKKLDSSSAMLMIGSCFTIANPQHRRRSGKDGVRFAPGCKIAGLSSCPQSRHGRRKSRGCKACRRHAPFSYGLWRKGGPRQKIRRKSCASG